MSDVTGGFGVPVITSGVATSTPKEKGLLAQWWGDLESKAEDWTDELLYSYSKTELSQAVDDTTAGAVIVRDLGGVSARKAAAAADKWGGYIGDPEKLEGILNKVMVVVVILGIVYVIATFAPLIPRGGR